MLIVVVDGQGGGLGRILIDKLKGRVPKGSLLAVGTNAVATSAMLRIGADAGATGENAVVYNSGIATVLLGPSGISIPNAMHGEISPAMAQAVQQSPARKFLLPMDQCCASPTDGPKRTMEQAADALVTAALEYLAPLT